jgi:hypothetical protein
MVGAAVGDSLRGLRHRAQSRRITSPPTLGPVCAATVPVPMLPGMYLRGSVGDGAATEVEDSADMLLSSADYRDRDRRDSMNASAMDWSLPSSGISSRPAR